MEDTLGELLNWRGSIRTLLQGYQKPPSALQYIFIYISSKGTLKSWSDITPASLVTIILLFIQPWDDQC